MFWGTVGGRIPVLDLDFVDDVVVVGVAAAAAAGADGEVASGGLALACWDEP